MRLAMTRVAPTCVLIRMSTSRKGYESAFSARDRARVIIRISPSKTRGCRECRVLAATHGPPAKRKAGGSYHRSSRIIRHSLRDGFNAYSVLSLGTGLSCSHRPQDHHLARLASASGGQDHTPSQSALTMLVLHHPRVHRSPASRVVTTAIRPSWRRDGRETTTIF